MTKQNAIKWLQNLKKDIGKTEHQDLWHYEQALDEIIEALQQEPKRGHWIDKGDFYVCSECGKRMTYAVLDSELSQAYAFMSDYCPHCGARMERTMTREEALEILDTIPTIGEQVDALEMAIKALQQEEIIHCEDCKHWHEWENGAGSCHRSSIMWVGTDCYDYCSLAEGR